MDTEKRWDGPAAVKALGDDPPRSAINALFAIPGDSKSDSSLPHHDVSDGKVGAADKEGCIAAIGALNGSRGGVSASAAEKNKAYSHLASHLRAMGVDPPAKQFAAGQPVELRAQRRSSMLRVPERLSLRFGAAGIEMRAKPNGTGGTSFEFNGYFAVFDHPFQMWDFWGDEFSELVDPSALTRTLANNCDVPFLIGHNDAGIPMARTRSGTMTLGADGHGGWAHVPAMDGSREDVRALASAHERGDMDEMSCAFMVLNQQWSPDYMERRILEMDLHKGDVSAVVFGANDGTAGSSMVGFPVESLSLRRPVGMLRNRRPGEQRDGGGYPDDSTPDYDPQQHAAEGHIQCPGPDCPVEGGAMNSPDAKFCDQCGAGLYSEDGTIIISPDGVPEQVEGDGAAAAAYARAKAELDLRQRRLALLGAPS